MDCNSDHTLLFANIVCRLKKNKSKKSEPRLDFSVLNNNSEIATQFRIEVANRFNALEVEESGDEDPCNEWNQLEKY